MSGSSGSPHRTSTNGATAPTRTHEWDDAHLNNELRDLHADDPEFGYRFLHDELIAGCQQASPNRVHRLCRENQVWSVFAKKRGLGRKAGPPVHDDLVKRHFAADTPDLVWLTDITEHWTDEGKLYMCAFKDVCSGIVGYAMSESALQHQLSRLFLGQVANSPHAVISKGRLDFASMVL